MQPQSVFVAGGASGIGLEAARHFIDQGDAVTVIDVDETRLSHAARMLERPGANVLALAADVRDRASVDQAFAAGVARHGAVDVFIFTAGVLLPATLTDMSDADYDLTFDVNTKGFWRCIQAALPRFAVRGGAVVAVSSSSGQRPKAGNGAYAASKVALQFLARTLALEVAPRQIRVNCVCPSMVKTPLTDDLQRRPPRGGFTLSATTPLGRLCTEADVVQAIAFLCEDKARFITGTTIAVDGGATAGVPLRP